MRKSKKTGTERVYLRKGFLIFLSAVLLGSTAAFASSTASDDDAASQYGQATFIPQAPDYNDATMWVTADGDTDGTGADIHSCEPWLYNECPAKNIKVRAKAWRKQH